jgi:hypothetical protein
MSCSLNIKNCLPYCAVLLVLLGSSKIALADNFKLGGECIVFDYDSNFPVGTSLVSTYHWSGACDHAGFAAGPGELQSFWNARADELSVGTMVAGRLEGGVVTTGANGGRFEGTYSHGLRTGRGVYTLTRDSHVLVRYEGDFVNGLAQGHGVESVAGVRVFEGEFVRGARLN